MPKIYQLLTDEIEEFVLQYINEHQLKPHDKLPTERELSTSLNVNRITLRNGLQKLIDKGIIYAPVRVLGNKTIVTNGDQTDTIYELMDKQQTFEQALRTREFEPDAPNYTPRISGIMHIEDGNYNYAMSILKSNNGNPEACNRYTFAYNNPVNGEGHFIHTYKCDGNPLPSFEGEPKLVPMMDDMDAFTDMLWNSLNEDNKVSLFVRYIDIETGKYETKIVNKNK